MDLVDEQKRIKGLILVITITYETKKQVSEYGSHYTTIHKPEVHLFNSVNSANKYLQEESRSVLGAWEISRDLSGGLVRDKMSVSQERTIIDVSKIPIDKPKIV